MQDLYEMWKIQQTFNQNLLDYSNLTLEDQIKWTKEYVLYLGVETGEFLKELPLIWKAHRGTQDLSYSRSNMLTEWIDIYKYWLSLGLVWGFSPEEFVEEFRRKSMVVEQKFKQERIRDFIQPDKKIVGVDIDGVLAEYPLSFLNFVNKELGTSYTIEQVKAYNIAECLGLPLEQVMELKHKYRETGQKRFIPLCSGAREFLVWLEAQGYAIVLLTSRPFDKYKRILPDTMEWLLINDLPYDALMFDENKNERLLKEFGPERLAFFVDDVSKYANSIADLGVRCYLINKPYNLNDFNPGNVVRIDSLQELVSLEGNNN